MSRIKLIITLIIAGEMVFGLPFHTARFFRPTFLDVFGFTNTQLGDLFAIYGITAMIAYFPGGALADRYTARSLLAASLAATSLGGVYMATIPGAFEMAVLYGFWGVTTILLFWGALIRATRDWGGHDAQGMAFGILEAGRGFVAASVAAVCVALFAWLMPDSVDLASDDERRAAFRAVILAYSLMTMIAAVLAWFVIPVPDYRKGPKPNPLSGMKIVLGRPVIWAQAAIIVFAYCGYKAGDFYALYAQAAFAMNEVDAAAFVTLASYMRPVAAIVAGLVADRFDATRSIGIAFVMMLLSYLALSVLTSGGTGTHLIYINVYVSFFAVFALRGIYFALLEENRTPKKVTGAAVGMVSLIGFTPEIFFAPIAGRIVDASPGMAGMHDFFLFLAMIALGGVLAALVLKRLQKGGVESMWPARVLAAGGLEINAAANRS